MVTKEKGVLHFGLLLLVAVLLAGGWFAYEKLGFKWLFSGSVSQVNLSCDPLTPASLKQLYDASGVQLKSGEKCSISKEAYLLKLIYDNYEKAEKAKFGLMAETSGNKKQIEGADLITNEGNSSAFYIEGQELKVLVMVGTTDEAKVKGMVLGLKKSTESTNILDVGGKATDSKIKSEINQVKTALELYFAEKEVYPKTLDELVTEDIIKTIPANPKTGKPYDFFSNGESYTISTTLSDGSLYQVSSEE